MAIQIWKFKKKKDERHNTTLLRKGNQTPSHGSSNAVDPYLEEQVSVLSAASNDSLNK
jgi:hypothetical protein